MDFSLLHQPEPGMTTNPFAAKRGDGEWLSGLISVSFLNQHFGQYSTATEMKAATNSEGLRRYFDWLVEQGLLQA